ncbi:unnamed protein product [Trichobilharzia regenti]|nr:unnamed protein product [Trichobilharzia regenti]
MKNISRSPLLLMLLLLLHQLLSLMKDLWKMKIWLLDSVNLRMM